MCSFAADSGLSVILCYPSTPICALKAQVTLRLHYATVEHDASVHLMERFGQTI